MSNDRRTIGFLPCPGPDESGCCPSVPREEADDRDRVTFSDWIVSIATLIAGIGIGVTLGAHWQRGQDAEPPIEIHAGVE